MFGLDKFLIPSGKKAKGQGKGVSVSLDSLISEQKNALNILTYSSHKVHNVGAGNSRSPFKGRGMEFDEVREYHQGDDLRSLDWKVTARLGKPFTKLFHEEKERPFLILLDMRPSMHFGTRFAFKSVVAARIAALIVWGAKSAGDKVGGLVLSASEYMLVKPSKQRRNIVGFLKAASDAANDKGTKTSKSLSQAVSEIKRVTGLGGAVFVISDFYDFDAEVQKQLTSVAAHSDIVCVFVSDRLEETPPPAGVYRINNGNNASATINTADKRWRNEYTQLFNRRKEAVKVFCAKVGGIFVSVHTDDNLAEVLRAGIHKKRRKGYATAD